MPLEKKWSSACGRLVGHVDLACLEPHDQVLGRQVDQFDLGVLEDLVGHRLAHADMGERAHHVVQALDMLDVHRGHHVDARGEQFLDVLPALGVPAARRIRVREFVDQDDLRPPLEDGVDVHLGQRLTLVDELLARDHRQRRDERFGFLASVGFDDADDHVLAGLALFGAFEQHLVGFPDAGCGAEKDLQSATPLPFRFAEQCIWGGARFFSHGNTLFGDRRSSQFRVECEVEFQDVDDAAFGEERAGRVGHVAG